ncbi:DUF5722 domain-containing protein [Rubripirellula tenax]|uniref:DUF5722 domain-containing protein n=1 Tax=Rubripirellula tenax TaxID=2528015 RepID=UPI0011B6B03F|nr:DUF5722 domain-containing protein [Rubripirellula tenax]
MTIEGTVRSVTDGVRLADIPMDRVLGDADVFATLLDVPVGDDGSFVVTTPRNRLREGRDYDRIVSRWQLVRETDQETVAISHARYADTIGCRSPELPAANPRSKKGLGGWHIVPKLANELEELGVAGVTINLMVHSLIALEPGQSTTPFQWQGRTYHADNRQLHAMDQRLIAAAESDLMVSVILLVGNPAKHSSEVLKTIGHPDANSDGTFAMPNVTSASGVDAYGAIMNLIAERWSRPDGKFGRVHHWIIHNEVDAGYEWTNAGDKSAIEYMDLYQRSMRLTHMIARQYDPNARAFISLTHHWADAGTPKWYGSKRLLQLLTKFCAAEGDFAWGLAHHPYPQSLLKPRTWEDDQATSDFDTKKITPKNIEVLDAYMHLPEMRFGGELRPVHLSENGFNSPDYSEKSLMDQAAGMAFAWKKILPLESIQMWHYHNWIDNHGEGKLRIGLRKYPDDPTDPLGKKPIWNLYQALGTANESRLADPYLKTIGITDWSAAP